MKSNRFTDKQLSKERQSYRRTDCQTGRDKQTQIPRYKQLIDDMNETIHRCTNQHSVCVTLSLITVMNIANQHLKFMGGELAKESEEAAAPWRASAS